MNKDELGKKLVEISNEFKYAKGIIGAKDVIFELGTNNLSDAIKKFELGGDVTGLELIELKNIWQDTSVLIDSEGKPFVLYIPDFSNYAIYGNLPKYHLSWCRTLETMKNGGREDRYRPKFNIESNIFSGKDGSSKDTKNQLNACLNCVNDIKRNYPDKKFKFEDPLDLIEFFSIFGKPNLPIPSAAGIYETKYGKSWNGISKRYREYVDWQCEGDNCNDRDCSKQKTFLDVHHINGVKEDTGIRNLKALCKRCHSDEHGHYNPDLNKSNYNNLKNNNSKLKINNSNFNSSDDIIF